MEPLLPGNYYHIYNHANSNDNLFLKQRNYDFILEKYKKYIVPISSTYAFCLMPNHFHFLLRINEDENGIFQRQEICEKYHKLDSYLDKENFISNYISKQFSNLFSSYTQAFNKENSRRGSLFIKNFKRKNITDEKYFIRVVNYIHNNPVVHGFCEKPEQWKYSSYNAIISSKATLVKREEVLEWFDGLANFMYCHLRPMDI